MDYLYLFFVKLFCLSAAGFVFYLLHLIDGNAILELGYRPGVRRRMKKEQKLLPKWDRFLHWSLAYHAKLEQFKVWFYWGIHMVAVIGFVISLVLFFIPIPLEDWRSRVSIEVYCPVVTFVIQTGVRLTVDLFILPSEKKRYGIRETKDKE